MLFWPTRAFVYVFEISQQIVDIFQTCFTRFSNNNYAVFVDVNQGGRVLNQIQNLRAKVIRYDEILLIS